MAEKTIRDFFVRVQREALEIRNSPIGVNRNTGNENMKEYWESLRASVDMALDAYIATMTGVEQ